jgi:GT2 family glycosyltransferase
VSVIVPCFNEEPAIVEACFASLRAQTFADFECIVVDDSTGDSRARACQAACARDARFAYLRPELRLGIAGSLNLAISHARGSLVARADCDDLSHPDRLARQVAVLQSRDDIGVLGCALAVIDPSGRPTAQRRYPAEHDQIARAMQITNAMAHPTVVIRRSVLDLHGVYDPAFRYCEDLELWLRLINAGVRFANLAAPLVTYRQETTQRPATHWRANLSARAKNLSQRMILRRLLGLTAIAAWSVTPEALRRLAYDRLILQAPTAP